MCYYVLRDVQCFVLEMVGGQVWLTCFFFKLFCSTKHMIVSDPAFVSFANPTMSECDPDLDRMCPMSPRNWAKNGPQFAEFEYHLQVALRKKKVGGVKDMHTDKDAEVIKRVYQEKEEVLQFLHELTEKHSVPTQRGRTRLLPHAHEEFFAKRAKLEQLEDKLLELEHNRAARVIDKLLENSSRC